MDTSRTGQPKAVRIARHTGASVCLRVVDMKMYIYVFNTH